jgi:hypothetical protein
LLIGASMPIFPQAPQNGRRQRDLIALMASSLALGCHPATEQVFEDVGKACLMPEGANLSVYQHTSSVVTLQADRPAQIVVVIPSCLSASCSHDPQAACSAAVTGDRIDITSRASFLMDSGVCTKDCRGLSARCLTPPLAAGIYLVRHGADSMTVTVPSVVPVPCMGSTPFDRSVP